MGEEIVSESFMSQYGLAGIVIGFFMTMTVMIFKWFTSNMSQVVENNTIALTKVHEVLKGCKR